MAQLAMVSTQVEIKSSASTFFGFFKDKLPQLPQLLPDNFKSFRVLEGGEIRDGVVIWCKYELGSTMTVKAKIELSESSKTVKFIVLEGDLLKHYNAYNAKFQMNSSGCVKVTIEFDKASGSCPNPDAYLSLSSKIIKQLDAYLTRT